MNMKKILVSVSTFLLPAAAFAAQPVGLATNGSLRNVDSVIQFVTALLRFAVPFLISLAIVYFLWAIVGFIQGAGDEKKRAGAKAQLIYSVIALAVMVSVYGLINFVTSSVGLDSNSGISIPNLPIQ